MATPIQGQVHGGLHNSVTGIDHRSPVLDPRNPHAEGLGFGSSLKLPLTDLLFLSPTVNLGIPLFRPRLNEISLFEGEVAAGAGLSGVGTRISPYTANLMFGLGANLGNHVDLVLQYSASAFLYPEGNTIPDPESLAGKFTRAKDTLNGAGGSVTLEYDHGDEGGLIFGANATSTVPNRFNAADTANGNGTLRRTAQGMLYAGWRWGKKPAAPQTVAAPTLGQIGGGYAGPQPRVKEDISPLKASAETASTVKMGDLATLRTQMEAYDASLSTKDIGFDVVFVPENLDDFDKADQYMQQVGLVIDGEAVYDTSADGQRRLVTPDNFDTFIATFKAQEASDIITRFIATPMEHDSGYPHKKDEIEAVLKANTPEEFKAVVTKERTDKKRQIVSNYDSFTTDMIGDASAPGALAGLNGFKDQGWTVLWVSTTDTDGPFDYNRGLGQRRGATDKKYAELNGTPTDGIVSAAWHAKINNLLHGIDESKISKDSSKVSADEKTRMRSVRPMLIHPDLESDPFVQELLAAQLGDPDIIAGKFADIDLDRLATFMETHDGEKVIFRSADMTTGSTPGTDPVQTRMTELVLADPIYDGFVSAAPTGPESARTSYDVDTEFNAVLAGGDPVPGATSTFIPDLDKYLPQEVDADWDANRLEGTAVKPSNKLDALGKSTPVLGNAQSFRANPTGDLTTDLGLYQQGLGFRAQLLDLMAGFADAHADLERRPNKSGDEIEFAETLETQQAALNDQYLALQDKLQAFEDSFRVSAGGTAASPVAPAGGLGRSGGGSFGGTTPFAAAWENFKTNGIQNIRDVSPDTKIADDHFNASFAGLDAFKSHLDRRLRDRDLQPHEITAAKDALGEYKAGLEKNKKTIVNDLKAKKYFVGDRNDFLIRLNEAITKTETLLGQL